MGHEDDHALDYPEIRPRCGRFHWQTFLASRSENTNMCLCGTDPFTKDAETITQTQAQSGIWGWTDLESSSEKPAKLKHKGCQCVVKKKPNMIFVILVQTADKGKQGWKENAEINNVNYPNSPVYVGSSLASFSKQHEEKRYDAWKKALTSYWPAHYENPAAALTADTCPDLQKK